MGACVSVHKDPDSVMKLRLSIGSKNEKLLISSPVKERAVAVNAGDSTAGNGAVSCLRSPARDSSTASKDEAFFDSQPWLESDCEDDFLSVNGDFTPSRGNTPVHPNSLLGKIVVNKVPVVESPSFVPEHSPPDKKKRLSELFKESLRGLEYNDEDTSTTDKNGARPGPTLAQHLRSTSGTPPYFSRANSGRSSERTPTRVLEVEGRSLKSPQCCLPKMLSSRSLNERRRRMSPGRNLG